MKLKPHIAGFFLVSMLFALYWNSDKILESVSTYKAFQEQNLLRNSKAYQTSYDEMLARLITYGSPDTSLIHFNRQYQTDLQTIVENAFFGYFENYVPTFPSDSNGARALGAATALEFYYEEKYQGRMKQQADSLVHQIDSVFQYTEWQKQLSERMLSTVEVDSLNHQVRADTKELDDLPFIYRFEPDQANLIFTSSYQKDILTIQTPENGLIPSGRILAFWDTSRTDFPFPDWPIHWEVIPS